MWIHNNTLFRFFSVNSCSNSGKRKFKFLKLDNCEGVWAASCTKTGGNIANVKSSFFLILGLVAACNNNTIIDNLN